jgi:ADP-heptose:LPS heptosyltransferase
VRRLLIRPGAIGDCILSLPALRHLKAEYTEVWISSPVIQLVQFADRVQSIASTGLDLVGIDGLEIASPLRQQLQSFDSIVSWYGTNRLEFREALASLGVPCEFHPALPPVGYPGHATDFFARQVGADDGFVSQIALTPSQPRGTTVIQPFSGSARKNWPLHCFAELAEQLPYKVEWTIGPEETLPQYLQPVHFTNLLELARWLSGAWLYIGNDSGITHLAAANGVPTLALFGETDPTIWAPRGPLVRVLNHTPLEHLSIPVVLAAAKEILNEPTV